MAVLKEIGLSLQDISQFHAKHIEERLKKRSRLTGSKEYNDLLDYYLEQVHQEGNGKVPSIFNDVEPGIPEFYLYVILTTTKYLFLFLM